MLWLCPWFFSCRNYSNTLCGTVVVYFGFQNILWAILVIGMFSTVWWNIFEFRFMSGGIFSTGKNGVENFLSKILVSKIFHRWLSNIFHCWWIHLSKIFCRKLYVFPFRPHNDRIFKFDGNIGILCFAEDLGISFQQQALVIAIVLEDVIFGQIYYKFMSFTEKKRQLLTLLLLERRITLFIPTKWGIIFCPKLSIGFQFNISFFFFPK